jgi:hypothetical protein
VRWAFGEWYSVVEFVVGAVEECVDGMWRASKSLASCSGWGVEVGVTLLVIVEMFLRLRKQARFP